jgi:hypothetical protein
MIAENQFMYVVDKLGEEELRKIAAVSPRIRILDSTPWWQSSETSDCKYRDSQSSGVHRNAAKGRGDTGLAGRLHRWLRAPNLKWIQTVLAGVDGILDKELAESDVTDQYRRHSRRATDGNRPFNYMLDVCQSRSQIFPR